jgi:Domain of unknown function (DUF4157)
MRFRTPIPDLQENQQTNHHDPSPVSPIPAREPSPASQNDLTGKGKASCACGGGCPRCEAGPVDGAVTSPESHERSADQAADEFAAGAPRAYGTEPGDRVPAPLRQYFEGRFGHDLSGVRIRAGESAAAEAQARDAAAFTTGPEITFGEGEYAPDTHEGRRLLTHELSHVIQQGAAPRNEAKQNPLIGFTGRAPRVQLQDNFLGGHWWDRPDAIKKLIKDNDNLPGKEIAKALEHNDLKGGQSKFRSEVIEGTTHEWRLVVTADFLDRASLNPGTKYGNTKDTVRYTEKGGIEVHEIGIQVNKILKSSAEDEKLFPKGTKASDESRVNLMAARTLYHEMIHALMRVDQESSKSTPTQATVGFTKKTENSPKLAASEQAVTNSVSKLVFATELVTKGGDLFAAPGTTLMTRAEKIKAEAAADKLDPKYMANLDKAIQDAIPFANKSDEHVDFLEKTVHMLLEEKHARQSAGEAFKLKEYQENSRLVDDYVAQVENTLLGLARAQTGRATLVLAGDKNYDRELASLKANVLNMYNLLDTEPDVTPGVGPKMFATPGLLTQPLDIGGNPVKEK